MAQKEDSIIKKIGLIVMSIFLVFQSYALVGTITQAMPNSWFATVIFAFLINIFVTGVFAFAGFALPSQQLLPKTYYQVKFPKQLKQIYKIFNVNAFRKLLLATVWREKVHKEKFFNGRADGLRNLIKQSKKSEFGHLLPFILISILCIYFAAIGLFKLSIISFLLNFFGNWYPIILQRHHRMRIARFFKE